MNLKKIDKTDDRFYCCWYCMRQNTAFATYFKPKENSNFYVTKKQSTNNTNNDIQDIPWCKIYN